MLEFLFLISLGNGWLRFRRERREAREISVALLNGTGVGLASLSLGLFGILTGKILLETEPAFIDGAIRFTTKMSADDREAFQNYFLMCRYVAAIVGAPTGIFLIKDLAGGERFGRSFVNFLYRYFYLFGLAFIVCLLASA